jgi:hypothetical protein
MSRREIFTQPQDENSTQRILSPEQISYRQERAAIDEQYAIMREEYRQQYGAGTRKGVFRRAGGITPGRGFNHEIKPQSFQQQLKNVYGNNSQPTEIPPMTADERAAYLASIRRSK